MRRDPSEADAGRAVARACFLPSCTVTSLNPLSLPTSPDRDKVFARARASAPVVDSRLGVWIVLDPPSVTRLLQDDRLVVPDVNAALGALEQRYNVQLPHLRWAASVLPLLANGEHHRHIRQPLAKFLSGEKRRTRLWPDAVAGLIASVLAKPRRFDAFRELLLPCINLIFAGVTGAAVDFEPLTLTKVFDRYASLRQLVDLERRVLFADRRF